MFYFFGGIFVICFVISICSSYSKLTLMGVEGREVVIGCIAQAASVFGIAAAIIFLIALFFEATNRRKRKRH